MKSKMFFLVISTFILSTTIVYGQDCSTNLSLFGEAAKVKNYDEALPYYDKLIEECPDHSLAIYQYGNRMFKHYSKAAENDEQKKSYAQQLIKNNEMRLELFPDRSDEGKLKAEIAQAMYDHEIGNTQEQFNAFYDAWNSDRETFASPKPIYTFFVLTVKLHDEGKKNLEEMFQIYDEVIEHIEGLEDKQAKVAAPLIKKQEAQEELSKKETQLLKNAEIYLKNYDIVKNSVNSVLGQKADCDKLIPLFEKSYDENKDDIDWLKSIAGRLYKKDCSKSDFFVQVVEQQNKIEPSAKSALYLGKLAEQEGDTNKALEYYKQSADLETDKMGKANAYYSIANMYKDKGSYSSARTYYNKAVNNQPSLGRAYLKIADMYAKSANDCGDDTFTKQAVYWLAADYAERAARVSPALKDNAMQTAESYRGRAPQKSDIFQSPYNGGDVISTDGCWINESITVPNL
ncbi:MAG: tetratricopeptide repeat protein [Bacteroidota bacterium]